MEVAKELGADFTIDVEMEDPLARIMEITGGKGVDVALDCTAGAGTIPILLGVEALKRKGGTIVVQGDKKRENSESFFINLTGAVGALIQDGQALGDVLVAPEEALRVVHVVRPQTQPRAAARRRVYVGSWRRRCRRRTPARLRKR